jgi:hypothetical protein
MGNQSVIESQKVIALLREQTDLQEKVIALQEKLLRLQERVNQHQEHPYYVTDVWPMRSIPQPSCCEKVKVYGG